jgi:hypothetical protein
MSPGKASEGRERCSPVFVGKVPGVALVLVEDDLEPNLAGGGLPSKRCQQRRTADGTYAL